MKSHCRTNRNRKGAAVTEFALTAPILFMMVFASIEFSRANMLLHTAAISATEGARRGILSGATADEIRATAFAELTPLGINEATVLVIPEDITTETEMITVGVRVPVNMSNLYMTPKFFLGDSVIKVVSITREAKSGKDAETKAAKARDMVAKGLKNGQGVKLKKDKKDKGKDEGDADGEDADGNGTSDFLDWLKSWWGG